VNPQDGRPAALGVASRLIDVERERLIRPAAFTACRKATFPAIETSVKTTSR